MSELDCVSKPYDWDSYKNILEKILSRINVDLDGACIIVETPDEDSRKLISETVICSQKLGFSIYSPCGKRATCDQCWGWRRYLYLEPQEIIDMRGTDRLHEPFFSLTIKKTEHHIWQDIAGDSFPTKTGNWNFSGL